MIEAGLWAAASVHAGGHLQCMDGDSASSTTYNSRNTTCDGRAMPCKTENLGIRQDIVDGSKDD